MDFPPECCFSSREPADGGGPAGQRRGDDQGSEERRSSSGLQGQGRPDFPSQSRARQEPAHPHGEETPSSCSKDLKASFRRSVCLELLGSQIVLAGFSPDGSVR